MQAEDERTLDLAITGYSSEVVLTAETDNEHLIATLSDNRVTPQE